MTLPLATYYTTAYGPGQTVDQSVPSRSLGGYAATNQWNGGVQFDLFNTAQDTDVVNSRPDYRAVYVYNPDPSHTYTDVRVYVIPRTPGATNFFPAVDPMPPSYIDSTSPQGVDVSTPYTAPVGITFGNSALSYGTGVSIGDLVPQSGRMVWLRRVPLATGGPQDTVDVVFQAADLSSLSRRVYWETVTTTVSQYQPSLIPGYVPTSTPFTDVKVDFMSTGGTRVTWQLSNQMVDGGVYTYQLQVAQTGTAASDDWINVGAPAVDAPALYDAEQRIWGMTPTIAYRVVLTTDGGQYTSPPAQAFGLLTVKDTLLRTEMIRKETLSLRTLTGVNGYLLKARRYGTRCSCVDPVTFEITNSSCPTCYGVGFVGGYYAPVYLTFASIPGKKATERVLYNETLGTDRPVTLRGRMPADTLISARDAWCAVGSDDRYYVHEIEEKVAWRGYPVIYDVELRLAPRSNILYTFELTRPTTPLPPYAQPEVLQL